MDATRAESLRNSVREVYSNIATNPRTKHPFVTGRPLAQNVGYPSSQLDRLPASAIDSFAGVAAVALFADFESTATVLDLGCGAGLDSLLAAQKLQSKGQVIGIDFSAEMVLLARHNAARIGVANVTAINGKAEQLPFPTASIDGAMVNGIFNLNPARTAIFAELARVLKPGGKFYAAEIVLRHPLPPDVIASETNWFA